MTQNFPHSVLLLFRSFRIVSINKYNILFRNCVIASYALHMIKSHLYWFTEFCNLIVVLYRKWGAIITFI